MKTIQFKPCSDTYGITGTSKQGSIFASFMDLETMFGQPAFEGKGDKVTTEFVVDYHADGERSTFTIYDYHYTRNFGRPEEVIEWSVGGTSYQDFEAFNEAQRLFEYTDIRYGEDEAVLCHNQIHDLENLFKEAV